MQHTRPAVLLVGALVVAGGVVALGPGGSATASVTGTQDVQQSIIAGESTAHPERVIASAAGTYEYANLPREAVSLTVRIEPAAGFGGNPVVASTTFDLSGTSGSGTFEGVSGDLTDTAAETGWSVEEFVAWDEGDTRTQTVELRVVGTLTTADGHTYPAFNETHEVTVRVTHLPSTPTPAPTANASTAMNGHVEFVNGDQSETDNLPTCYTASTGDGTQQECA